MTTKLQIWNKALRYVGFERIAALTDNIKSRYELSDVWATAPLEVLETGHWNFATITQSSSGTTTSPIPGYTHRHSLPSDWVRTIQISTASDFNVHADHRTENGYIYAQTATLYHRYLSSGAADDAVVPTWPPSFAEAVALRMAIGIIQILQPNDAQRLDSLVQRYTDQLRRAAQADMWSRHIQHRAATEAMLFPFAEMVAPQPGGR